MNWMRFGFGLRFRALTPSTPPILPSPFGILFGFPHRRLSFVVPKLAFVLQGVEVAAPVLNVQGSDSSLGERVNLNTLRRLLVTLEHFLDQLLADIRGVLLPNLGANDPQNICARISPPDELEVVH